MKTFYFFMWISGLFLVAVLAKADSLPDNFVYLRDVDASIQQDMRYYGYHNFVGRPIKGYEKGECVLTKPAALALARVQKELKPLALSLKVYDCYRPQMAVDDFIQWSQIAAQQEMKGEFYPRTDKEDFFKLGYVATRSGHTRGSTVDLTIVPIPTPKVENYRAGKRLTACFADYKERFYDGGIDMGTGFDCMDKTAHYNNSSINETARKNRALLRNVMIKYGFKPYGLEWWHFTLQNEPYKKTYFNFPVK